MNTALALWRKVSLGRTSNISTVPTTRIVGGLWYAKVLRSPHSYSEDDHKIKIEDAREIVGI